MSDQCDFITSEKIKNSPLGIELTLEQCEKLAKKVEPLCLEEGYFLFEEGETGEELYVIASGALEVVKPAGDNDWITLHLLKEGDITGELGFIDQRPHSASVRALSNAEIYSLSRESLESFLQTDPEIVYKIMRSIVLVVHQILSQMNLQHVEVSNYISKQHGRY